MTPNDRVAPGWPAASPAPSLIFDHDRVTGGDFTGQVLSQFAATGTRFDGCRFERMYIQDATLGGGMEQSVYVDCSFDGTVFEVLNGRFSRFERCTFREVDIRSWMTGRTELVDCVFSGTIRGAIFWGGPPPGAATEYKLIVRIQSRRGEPIPAEYADLALRPVTEFRGNDFSQADLIDVAFRGGVDLSAQIMPSRPDTVYLPDGSRSLEAAIADLRGQPGDAAAAAVEFLDEVVRRELDDGQVQLFLSEKTYTGGRPHIPLAFDALRRVSGLQ